MHSRNLVLILLITFAALLHPPGVLVSNSCSSSGFGEGPQDHPHAPFFVVYDLKGVAFSDVDCPPDKRQIHLTILLEFPKSEKHLLRYKYLWARMNARVCSDREGRKSRFQLYMPTESILRQAMGNALPTPSSWSTCIKQLGRRVHQLASWTLPLLLRLPDL